MINNILASIPIDIGALVGQVSSMEIFFENFMKKAGIVIALIAIILGTYIIASTLSKMATEQQGQGGHGKRLVAGSLLLVFGITIGVIVVTVYSSARV